MTMEFKVEVTLSPITISRAHMLSASLDTAIRCMKIDGDSYYTKEAITRLTEFMEVLDKHLLIGHKLAKDTKELIDTYEKTQATLKLGVVTNAE